MQKSPQVVNILSGVPFDVYIGRRSKWGNPYVVGQDGSRAQVVMAYRAWIKRQPELMAALPELEGKRLGCFCAPRLCHGEILINLASTVANHNEDHR